MLPIIMLILFGGTLFLQLHTSDQRGHETYRKPDERKSQIQGFGFIWVAVLIVVVVVAVVTVIRKVAILINSSTARRSQTCSILEIGLTNAVAQSYTVTRSGFSDVKSAESFWCWASGLGARGLWFGYTYFVPYRYFGPFGYFGSLNSFSWFFVI